MFVGRRGGAIWIWRRSGKIEETEIPSCNRDNISKAYRALAVTERERMEKGDMVISGQLSKLTPGMGSHHLFSYAMHERGSIHTWHQLGEGTISAKAHFTRRPGQRAVGKPLL